MIRIKGKSFKFLELYKWVVSVVQVSHYPVWIVLTGVSLRKWFNFGPPVMARVCQKETKRDILGETAIALLTL